MILVAFDHAHGAVHVRGGQSRILGQRLRAVAHAVAFDVRLVNQVDAVSVAQVVPRGLVRDNGSVRTALMLCCFITWMSWIMPSTVMAWPAIRVKLVPVHALEQNPLAVDQQIAVLDLHFAEADVHGDDFEHLAGGILEREQQLVEIRRFGGPLERVGNRGR